MTVPNVLETLLLGDDRTRVDRCWQPTSSFAAPTAGGWSRTTASTASDRLSGTNPAAAAGTALSLDVSLAPASLPRLSGCRAAMHKLLAAADQGAAAYRRERWETPTATSSTSTGSTAIRQGAAKRH